MSNELNARRADMTDDTTLLIEKLEKRKFELLAQINAAELEIGSINGVIRTLKTSLLL